MHDNLFNLCGHLDGLLYLEILLESDAEAVEVVLMSGVPS